MANYKDDFSKRRLSNVAEDIALEYYNSIDCVVTRYGLDLLHREDVTVEKFCKIPEFIRNTPDFIVIQKKCFLVEVKGCYDLLKLKICDMKSYDKWLEYNPILLFVYSSKTKEFNQIPYPYIKELIHRYNYPIDKYKDNGKEYYKIPLEDLYDPKEESSKGWRAR
jgi:hypothetical protein